MKPGERTSSRGARSIRATCTSVRRRDYVEQVYGEKELGGTQVRYLSGVPFDKFGLPVGLPERSYAADSETCSTALYGGLVVPARVLAGLVTAAFRGSEKAMHEDEGPS